MFSRIYTDNYDQDWLFEQIVTKGRTDYAVMMKERPTWPVIYHLSEQRAHLMRPFNFGGTVLEVGAGCGGVTGSLLEKADKVISIELSEQRAAILQKRYENNPKLTTIATPLQDYNPEFKFDAVVVVGVWEYSGKYFEGEDPYEAFLMYCKKLLKENGQLYIAIENKLGIKYFAGCKEDHYSGTDGKHFEGIQDYPNYHNSGARTFSKKEIRGYMSKVGIDSVDFYYPLPDYKMPVEIHSDWSFKNLDIVASGIYPTSDSSGPREYVFSEPLFFNTLKKAGLETEFTNSFVVIGNVGKPVKQDILYSRLVVQKKIEYRNFTKIYEKNNKIFVTKKAEGKGINIVNQKIIIEKLKKKLSLEFKFPNINEKGAIEFIQGESLAAKAFVMLQNHDVEGLKVLFNGVERKLQKIFKGKRLPCFVDLNLTNFIEKNNNLYLIDTEVLVEKEVDIRIIILRQVIDFYLANYSTIFAVFPEVDAVTDFLNIVWNHTEKELKEYIKIEEEISRKYFGFEGRFDVKNINTMFPSRVNFDLLFDKYHKQSSEFEALQAMHKQEKVLFDQNKDEIARLWRELNLKEAHVYNLELMIQNSKALKISRLIKRKLKPAVKIYKKLVKKYNL